MRVIKCGLKFDLNTEQRTSNIERALRSIFIIPCLPDLASPKAIAVAQVLREGTVGRVQTISPSATTKYPSHFFLAHARY